MDGGASGITFSQLFLQYQCQCYYFWQSGDQKGLHSQLAQYHCRLCWSYLVHLHSYFAIFTSTHVYNFLYIALVPSAALFILLHCKKPPHWSLKLPLVPTAFIMAVVWLNLEANEIVSILRAFGLLLNIDTGTE